MQRRRAIILFGWVFTLAAQGTGAPVVDRCTGKTAEGRTWRGRAIHLTPWRFNRLGDRELGTVFCIGRVVR